MFYPLLQSDVWKSVPYLDRFDTLSAKGSMSEDRKETAARPFPSLCFWPSEIREAQGKVFGKLFKSTAAPNTSRLEEHPQAADLSHVAASVTGRAGPGHTWQYPTEDSMRLPLPTSPLWQRGPISGVGVNMPETERKQPWAWDRVNAHYIQLAGSS